MFSFVSETPPPPYTRFAMDDYKPKGKMLFILVHLMSMILACTYASFVVCLPVNSLIVM